MRQGWLRNVPNHHVPEVHEGGEAGDGPETLGAETNMSESYEPKGYKFYSQTRRQEMMVVYEGEWKDWLCYKHPDGQWVSLRKATQSDLAELGNALVKAHHAR